MSTAGWQVKKDGLRFWANVITLALRDNGGSLRGFARIVRDFTSCHQREASSRSTSSSSPAQSSGIVVGIISGELDQIPEANQVFLDLVGYTREDLNSGRMRWLDMTASKYTAADVQAHEECLKFGACTPFEKELIRKDSRALAVSVATAMLPLAPFRWITFVHDLRNRKISETLEPDAGKGEADFSDIVGRSAVLQRLLKQVELGASTDATVLILGETGTGKELIARAVPLIDQRS